MADYAISNVPRRVVYANSGVGPYAFTFEVLANTDIAVYRGSTLLTLTTDYSVTINANGTGSVTLVTAGTGNITIVGARAIQRTSDYTTGGDLFASTLNTDLDSQTIYVQQVAETAERGLKAPVTDPTDINMTLPSRASRAGKTLAFDANGNPVVGEDIGNWRGNWASGTAYTVRDLVKDASNYNVYRCNTAHTSSGSTPISSNADSAKWDLVVDAAYAAQQATAAAASASAAASSASAASSSASAASTSASNASSSASSASTSATNASNSATAAAGSASSASSSASSASTSATNAANSATSASNSASTATTQATNASNSASSASTSATNAASSASAASTSASNASTSATNAANSATAASTSASNAATSETNSANSATASAASAVSAASSAASAAALLDNFDDRYLGAKSSDPALDNDGNALVVGALYFNTTDGVMKVYTASGWIAASSASVATLATFEFVATSGQTVFTGTDANGATLSYVAPALIVTLNGVRLRPGDDYTATNGTSITLVSAAALNDELVVDAFGSFLVANTYTIAQADTNFQPKSNALTAYASSGVGMRNRIINGAMVIDQRNAGASISMVNQDYNIDRWQSWNSDSTKLTVQQNAGSVTPPAGFTNYLGITSTSAYSVGAGDYFAVRQQIEGYNIADLGFGTANAKTVTLSFWVRSSLTGTFGGVFENAFTRSYPFTYTISAANTWEYKSVTITGDTSGSWNTTNGTGLVIIFSLGVGSNWTAASGAWTNGTIIGPTGATSVVGTNGATFYLTGVQLEVGSSATSFETRSYGTELMLCQRYFEKSYDQGVKPGATGSPGGGLHSFSGWNVTGTTSYIGHAKVKYSVVKRATPTFSCWDNANPPNGAKTTRFTLGVGNNDNQNASLADAGDSGINVYSSGTSNNTGIIFHWTAAAEL